MLLKINNRDFTEYIETGGYKFTLNDTDKDSGRTLDGKMWREFICYKVKIEVSFKEMPTYIVKELLHAVKSVYFQCEYFDPSEGHMVTGEFYNTSKPATCRVQKGGMEFWTGVSLSLIER